MTDQEIKADDSAAEVCVQKDALPAVRHDGSCVPAVSRCGQPCEGALPASPGATADKEADKSRRIVGRLTSNLRMQEQVMFDYMKPVFKRIAELYFSGSAVRFTEFRLKYYNGPTDFTATASVRCGSFLSGRMEFIFTRIDSKWVVTRVEDTHVILDDSLLPAPRSGRNEPKTGCILDGHRQIVSDLLGC